MDENKIFKRNLLALSMKDAELAQAISQCEADPTVRFIRSKSNHLVPQLLLAGHTFLLHSSFDPVKEGQRYSESYKKGGFLIFLGCGGGYHILPFLNKADVSTILIVEKNLAQMRSILEQIDLCPILTNPRVKILIDANPEQIQESVLKFYLPNLEGDLQTVTLASRVNLEQEYFSSLVLAIKGVINRIADDYTVQSFFGKKWFMNTLANLEKAAHASLTLPPVKTAIITGAGPSLEGQIKKIKNMRRDSFLIATDTSLPCLLSHDLEPDLAISIDCQQVTYHHFMSGYPAHIPLVLDLASPPVLTRFTDKLLFFASNHPFSFYITSFLRNFPALDTSGGNVAHAGLSLAQLLGAETIYLFGIDFAYPEGKTYARGTYLYPYFNLSASRTTPLETHFWQFLFRSDTLIKKKLDALTVYTTRSMLNYKERMEQSIVKMEAVVKQETGNGMLLDIPLRSNPEGGLRFKPTIHTLFSPGACKTDWKTFLKGYYNKVKKLPLPHTPLGTYFEELTNEEKLVLLTLLPAGTALGEKNFGQKPGSSEVLLKKTKAWTLACLKEYI